MLKLYHAPHSRSSRIVQLLDELGATDEVDIMTVTIPRRDGSGGQDPKNPHPEGKVPMLVHDGTEIWETPAIILYLTDLFPASGFGPVIGDRQRGTYLSWLAYYGDVVEPVMVLQAAGLQHPYLEATFRGIDQVVARLEAALAHDPFLLGDRFSAVDLLLCSPFTWFPEATPDVPVIRAWVARCESRPSSVRIADYDAKARSAA